MSDLTIRQNIQNAMQFEPALDAAHIGVAVDKGIVTLSGHVNSYAEKLMAERIAKRVVGVKGLAQELEVEYASDKKTADDQIAKRAINILEWDTTIPTGTVLVKVEKGFVTLTGSVSWNYQKVAAQKAIEKLSGVRGINNMITIMTSEKIDDVKKRIEDALTRDAEVEAKNIKVTFSDGSVSLEGRVHTFHERDLVENAAWSAPSVRTVNNHLIIS